MTVKLDRQRNVPVKFTSMEETLTVDSLLKSKTLESAMSQLAQQVESELAGIAARGFYSWAGTPGTAINSAGLIGPNLSVAGNDTTTTAPWERIRNGNGTDGGEAGIGPENRLVHRAHAKWQQQTDVDDRAIRATNWSSVDAGGFGDGLLGAVDRSDVRAPTGACG